MLFLAHYIMKNLCYIFLNEQAIILCQKNMGGHYCAKKKFCMLNIFTAIAFQLVSSIWWHKGFPSLPKIKWWVLWQQHSWMLDSRISGTVCHRLTDPVMWGHYSSRLKDNLIIQPTSSGTVLKWSLPGLLGFQCLLQLTGFLTGLSGFLGPLLLIGFLPALPGFPESLGPPVLRGSLLCLLGFLGPSQWQCWVCPVTRRISQLPEKKKTL